LGAGNRSPPPQRPERISSFSSAASVSAVRRGRGAIGTGIRPAAQLPPPGRVSIQPCARAVRKTPWTVVGEHFQRAAKARTEGSRRFPAARIKARKSIANLASIN
jgi:hypothetical protein